MVGVNSCYCVGDEIIKGAAVLDKLLYSATGGLDLRHRIVRSVDVGKMRFIPSAPGNAVKEVLGYLSAEFCLGFLLQYLNTR